MKITGNTVGNPTPRTDWNQTDPNMADYLKGRDALEMLIQNVEKNAEQKAIDRFQVGTTKPNSNTLWFNKKENLDDTTGDAHIMAHDLNMAQHQLYGVPTPTANDQAANMGYVNAQVKKAAPRNLLDNSDFTNPVNQRGIVNGTEIPVYAHFLDRWRSINIPFIYGNNANIGLYASGETSFLQYIPDREKLVGKTLTFAAKCSGKVLIATRKIVGSTSWDWTPHDGFDGKSNSAAIVEEGNGKVYVQIGLYAEGDYVEWAALYEGEYTLDTLPEYQPKGYGAELAECQRYFYRLGNNANLLTSTVGFNHANGVSAVEIPTPVTMRTKPQISVRNIGYLYVGTNKITPSSLNVDCLHGASVRCFVPNTGITERFISALVDYDVDFIADL